MDISYQLTVARKLAGLSQTSVAKKLNVSRQAISKWENGHNYPDIDHLVLLSQLYAVSVDNLLQKKL